jgi:diguanylate cyclase (GGDEF)-like protein/PAS domain S-box-containing protein
LVGGVVRSPSRAVVGFLSAVPLLVGALLVFPVPPVRSLARAVMLLDGGAVAASTLFVSWGLVLGPVYRSHQGDVFAQVVTLAYPAGDVLIVIVLLSVAVRASRSAWIPLAFVGAGVLALAFSDSAFAYLSQSGSYGFGLNVDIGWILAFTLIALAPIWTGETELRRVSATSSSRVGLLVPYIPVAGALAVASGYLVSGRNLGAFLFATAIIAAIILGCRQLAALFDSVSLGSEQAARFAALVQRSSDLTTIISDAGTILYQSPSSLSVLGQPNERLTGRAFGELVHPDDTPAFYRMLAQVTTRPGAEATGEWRLRHQSGHHVEVESRLVNLFDDPSVRGVTINSRDISERKTLEDELRIQAVHDPLTGLPNRTLLNDRLERLLTLQKRDADHHDLAVLFVDLDDFKSVNEGLGHAAGDELLREVARRLLAAVRSSDTVARTGGDEFAVVLDSTFSASHTGDTTDRILDIFNHPFLLAGKEHANQASVGITVSSGEMTDAARLLQEADIAMHAAKVSGKGRRETYKPGMRELVIDQLQLAADMRHAVERRELVVFYQPIVETSTGVMNGVEALMRWQHPTRGLLTPAKFIPIAEASGLIIPMGRWLLRQACHDLRSWDGLAGTRPLRLNVNLAAPQLDDFDLIEDVATALSDSQLDPGRLMLEITETVLLRDYDAAITVFGELRELGIELAIDDFGTGYSSLSYLRQLPVDEIKIDRSFINPIAESDEAARLVHTIIQLADDLQLRTVAEGIETEEQLDQLRNTTCGLVQGYLFAAPLSEQQIRHRLQNGTLTWPPTPQKDTAEQLELRDTSPSARPDRGPGKDEPPLVRATQARRAQSRAGVTPRA